MHDVKRVAAVIKPTETMLNWLHEQSDNNQSVTLEMMQRDCTVLLLPPFEGPNQAKTFLKHIYNGLFESEMTSWGLGDEQWPKDRSFKMFNEWFTVELHSVIFDMGDLEDDES